MKNNKKTILRLSLITAMLLGSSAYAGKIITDAPDADNGLYTAVSTPDKQFGFGGWNFSNIDVRIVNIADFNTSIPGSNFDTDTGFYTTMGTDLSFESDIKNTAGTIVGHIHGKDWPVGEPSGIKIINGDTATKHGKPTNCIMTSSYLAGGYLGEGNIPVLCSSPFQSHKRFKINLLPTSIEGAVDGSYGKPVDLVFNLEADDNSIQRYQVLQKINNYTGKRLDGYKMEVLVNDTNATSPLLTFSLGAGEGDEGADIWGTEDMANMSHGLWGPVDDNFDEPGFFDDVRAYYPVALDTNKTTISYTGDMQGGNYQSLFGNWLPDIWEPTAIFFDDDNDPETDALLVAYWGDPLNTGTDGWHKGKIDNWETPTDQEFLQWTTDPLYSEGGVEDVLNLGLNYIINIGDNTQIGSTFILRVTPHVAADQTPPNYVDGNGTVIPIPPVEDEISDGTVAISPAPTFVIGDTLLLIVKDADQDLDPTVKDTTTVTVSTDTGDKETVTLTETDVTSTIFTANIISEITTSSPVEEDGIMNVIKDSVVTVSYSDNTHSDTASTTATIPADDTDDAVDSSGDTASSGGGCTYNPNSKNFDMTFLFMIALGLLYPFRRRFLK